MKIVQINLFDYQGGAAKIAMVLLEAMIKAGHEVTLFAHHKSSHDNRVVHIPIPDTEVQRSLMEKQQRQGLFDLFSMAMMKVFMHPAYQEADIVHLHCVNAGYFSHLLLPFLATKPMVWTLHDPLAFTGGCLHADNCNRWFEQACADCPLDAKIESLKPQRFLVQQLKADIYKFAKFTVVCPARCLQQQAAKSILQGHDIRLIYNAVDTLVFAPRDKREVRKKLKLPVDKRIIMFAAHGGFNVPLKGGKQFSAALQKIHYWYPDLLLLNIGSTDSKVLENLPVKRIDVPYINDSSLMADFYAASDLFISASLSEVFGLTICEAMACGTPVVAFATGGISEIVVHNVTGYLAKTGDVEGLATGIAYLLDNQTFRKLAGENSRKRVLENFEQNRMIAEYAHLYEELLPKDN